MNSLAHYARLWLAGARYSVIRTMMFRADFIMWSLVELFWMGVNLLLIAVVYQHTDSIAGWGPWEMTLIVCAAGISISSWRSPAARCSWFPRARSTSTVF
jgi:ABC-type uncharacterized transport system permease subunit